MGPFRWKWPWQNNRLQLNPDCRGGMLMTTAAEIHSHETTLKSQNDICRSLTFPMRYWEYGREKPLCLRCCTSEVHLWFCLMFACHYSTPVRTTTYLTWRLQIHLENHQPCGVTKGPTTAVDVRWAHSYTYIYVFSVKAFEVLRITWFWIMLVSE